MTDIYKLKLHESIEIRRLGGFTITRVPGGWLYRFLHTGSVTASTVFVPFDNEFMANPVVPTPDGEET